MRRIGLAVMATALIVFLSGCGGNGDLAQSQAGNHSAAAVQTEADAPEETTEKQVQADDSLTNGQTEADGDSEEAEERQNTASASTESEQAFTSLEIEISEGTIYIRSGETFSLTRHNGKTVDYEISDDTLYIKESRAEDMVLVLPENESYERLSLTVKNGHAYGEGSLTVDSLDLWVKQGEVSLEDITVLQDSKIQTDGGSASVYGDPGTSVTADCQQGHLSLAVPFAESDCNYTVRVSGGNIHVGSHDYHGRSDSHTVDHNADRSLELSCTHGDLSVEFDR